jgi:hypothetical protein
MCAPFAAGANQATPLVRIVGRQDRTSTIGRSGIAQAHSQGFVRERVTDCITGRRQRDLKLAAAFFGRERDGGSRLYLHHGRSTAPPRPHPNSLRAVDIHHFRWA